MQVLTPAHEPLKGPLQRLATELQANRQANCQANRQSNLRVKPKAKGLTRLLTTVLALSLGMALPGLAGASTVSDWNALALAEVRLAKFGPPVVARALAITHTCIYDAWAAYDNKAIGTQLGGSLRRPANMRADRAAQAESVSFAAYRCLVNLFPSAQSAARLRLAMTGLGYNPDYTSTDTFTAAGIGNKAAEAVILARRNDGSNQYGDLNVPAPATVTPYADYTGYRSRYSAMGFCTPQLVLTCAALNIPSNTPLYWQPLTFTFYSPSVANGVETQAQNDVVQKFIAPHWENVRPFALSSARQFDTHPAVAAGPLLQNGNTQIYAANVEEILKYSRELTPQRKLIVEYWADGPESELPPGHWGLLAQHLSKRNNHSIEKDAKMFFAMHNASFDAGIVVWHLKRKYDSVRPITAIRYAKQGQSVLAWGGPGFGTESIQGEKWIPYNPGSNLTPAFPGFVSGHSGFSSASARALQLVTGSDVLQFQTTIPVNFGRVEPGVPAVPTVLQYKTLSSAVYDAGMSRLYGGIHFAEDNTVGQTLGNLIGEIAYAKAAKYFNGTAP